MSFAFCMNFLYCTIQISPKTKGKSHKNGTNQVSFVWNMTWRVIPSLAVLPAGAELPVPFEEQG